jgi:hypothetical protein
MLLVNWQYAQLCSNVTSKLGAIGNCEVRLESSGCTFMTDKRPMKKKPTALDRTHRTTGINLPSDIWELLNRVAFQRSKLYGGRASVSALLVELVERHRKELEKELDE